MNKFFEAKVEYHAAFVKTTDFWLKIQEKGTMGQSNSQQSPGPTAQSKPQQSPEPTAQSKWESFFKDHRDLVCADVPRVFARELIGLETFGYKPEFNENGLCFWCNNSGKASQADCEKYLNALRDAGFGPDRDRSKILETISNYLFLKPNVFKLS